MRSSGICIKKSLKLKVWQHRSVLIKIHKRFPSESSLGTWKRGPLTLGLRSCHSSLLEEKALRAGRLSFGASSPLWYLPRFIAFPSLHRRWPSSPTSIISSLSFLCINMQLLVNFPHLSSSFCLGCVKWPFLKNKANMPGNSTTPYYLLKLGHCLLQRERCCLLLSGEWRMAQWARTPWHLDCLSLLLTVSLSSQ